jgi:hypothetical protein
MVISMELLMQISLSANFGMMSSDEVIAEKLQYVAGRFGAINQDKSLSILGIRPVEDTVRVAYALYKQHQEQRLPVPFPKSPIT